MRIERTTLKCFVHQASGTELAWLEGALTYSQGGQYGAKVCYLKSATAAGTGRYFGAGLIRTVLREARKEGLAVTVDDSRRKSFTPAPVAQSLLTKTPHYYQIAAAEAFIRNEAATVELPTGSGKTIVTALLVEAFRGARVLFLVSDRVLVESTAETIVKDTGLPVSRTLKAKGPPGEVVAMTLQSVYAQLKKSPTPTRATLKTFDVVIVDEAHQVPAQTFESVCSAVTAYWRFALSATPFSRADKKSAPLLALFGGLAYRKTEGELAREGFIPKAIIRMVVYEQAEFFLGKYPAAYTAQIVQSQGRNDLIAQCVALALKPCLVLFTDIKHHHGPTLRLRVLSEGFTCELVDSKTPIGRRREVIAALNARRLDVAVASTVFNVGVDVPALRSVVIVGGGKAVIRTVQRLGRGMRNSKGKKFFQVWDVLDWSKNFRKGRGTWMAKHAHERLKTYRKRGHAVFVGNAATGPWEKHPPIEPGSRAGRVQAMASDSV